MDTGDIHEFLEVAKNRNFLDGLRAFFVVLPIPYTTSEEILVLMDESQAFADNTIQNVFVLASKIGCIRGSDIGSSATGDGKCPDVTSGGYTGATSGTSSESDYLRLINDTRREVYDGLKLAGDLGEIAMNSGLGINTASDIMAILQGYTYSGNYGDISYNANSEPLLDFVLLTYVSSTYRFEESLDIAWSASEGYKLSVMQKIEWKTGELPSPDACFLNLEDCYKTDGISAITVVYIFIGVIAAICGMVGLSFLLRRYFSRKEMEKGPNKIILTSDDVVFVHKKSMSKMSKLAKSSFFEKPDILKASEPNYSMTSLNEYVDFSETARYNGELVHVKELSIHGFEMKSKILSFLKTMRELRHENLNVFLGFINDPIRPAIITEFCNRGSLEDVIHNEDIRLDWDFKLSLLTDLVRGLRYVHSCPLKHHGNVKSRNCVIDSRWVLKLTDYGLPNILEKSKVSRDLEAKDLLWTAPENLRDPVLLLKGTVKGDVYSFAIIVQEIILRTSPFSTTGLSPEEIIQKLKKPPPLIRPSVSQQAAPPEYIQLMKQCWAEMADMRPDIEQIYQQFKAFNHGKKMNIVDTMFKMLEKYSTDLEEIVRDRTTQLEEEKKKTDQLLSRMLPGAIAESLKLGKAPEAETFAEVTIYFSDIVGFTTISAMSNPMQVVDLLNDLYTMFDATIDNYDVYKVETIGDAYMVSSGIPTRNGNRHAGEIGTMALDLLSQCGTFTIRHMPEVPLRLRIGLHTGPCVAGVVGLTMPRYCLFGDTVNTASRMESTGTAFRIHISQSTKDKLDELTGYQTEYRGEVELKGKGLAKSFWLTGKDGFEKVLPIPPPLTTDDNHGIASLFNEKPELIQTVVTTVTSKAKGSGKFGRGNKTNLADLVGAISTLRRAANNIMERHNHDKSDKTGSGTTGTTGTGSMPMEGHNHNNNDKKSPASVTSNNNLGKAKKKSGTTSPLPKKSSQSNASLTPITLEEKEEFKDRPIELTPVVES